MPWIADDHEDGRHRVARIRHGIAADDGAVVVGIRQAKGQKDGQAVAEFDFVQQVFHGKDAAHPCHGRDILGAGTMTEQDRDHRPAGPHHVQCPGHSLDLLPGPLVEAGPHLHDENQIGQMVATQQGRREVEVDAPDP